MNLPEQVEPLGQALPLGFLTRRHAHNKASQFTSIQRWLKRASKPSRVLQGTLNRMATIAAPEPSDEPNTRAVMMFPNPY